MDPQKLIPHIGHEIELVAYGEPPANLAFECMDCGEVLADVDLR